MMRRLVCVFLALALLMPGVCAEGDFIKWVDFDVPYEALEAAYQWDLKTHETERPLSWISILALASTRKGSGHVTVGQVNQAAGELSQDAPPEEFLGAQAKYYTYFLDSYTAVLGGLVGSYAIAVQDEAGQTVWKPSYGVKAFSPVASGYWYSHYDDFGASRGYGFARKHLGNDLMGSLGTPITAVEGGRVEALGWNQYGGWRIGIRSHDNLRYYYYAHLRKDTPYAANLKEGDIVQAGDVIGYMGRTGYSTKENVNNINQVHLHFGLQLVFDESQKEANSEIWIDVYNIVRFLSRHRSTVTLANGEATRAYPYRDLDREA